MVTPSIEELWELFTSLGADALSMNHYDLYEQTSIPAEIWKGFLNNPEVKQWIQSEVSMLQESELRKLTKDVSKSRSVGQAQIMNTLAKLNETKVTKEGPIFIYSYVPLNKNEQEHENAHSLDDDIFKI